MEKLNTGNQDLHAGLSCGIARIPNPSSHWEWERKGLSFDDWKKQIQEQQSNAPTYIIPGPGGQDFY